MFGFVKDYIPLIPSDRDRMGLVLLPLLIALLLLILDRYGLQDVFYRNFSDGLRQNGYDHNQILFFSQVYFSSVSVVLFILIPLVFHWIFPSNQTDPFGLSLRYCGPHWRIYILLIGIMLPILWGVSLHPSFYHFYPMYKPVNLEFWVLYELVYLLQFFCVEFFFRGFALFRLEQRFGFHAVTLMVIPYALIHIHKPFPEALGSIVAGLVLGWLALKSRSIWPGVMVHCSVALSMDVFALIRSGRMSALFS